MRNAARRAAPWALGLAALLCPVAAFADTSLGGEIASDLTLTTAGSPYLVASDLVVRNGATLTIQAGVTVRVAPGVNLTVESGALRVLGTSSARAVITSAGDVAGGTPHAGDWGVLAFLGGTNDALTRLEQVDIRYGQGLRLQAASPTLKSVAIRSMAGAAVEMDLASFPTGGSNSASDCGLNAIRVAAGEMTTRGTWGLRGIPFVIEGTVSIGAAPTITAVSPTTLEQDSATPVTISGTRLDGTTAVTFPDTGVTGQVQAGGTSTSLPVLVNVDPAATLGTRTFVVDAAAGLASSGTVTLQVVPGTPVLISSDPTFAATGSPDTTVTLSGRKFNGLSVARVDGVDVATTFVSPTRLQAVIPAANLAAPGTLAITVANPDAAHPGAFLVSAAVSFTVAPPPTITAITPDRGARGALVGAAIAGTGLSGATAITFQGTGVSATVQPGGTATNLPVRITIDPTAATGARTFQVTALGGTASSGTVTFTVTVPLPVVSSISPSVGILGTPGASVTSRRWPPCPSASSTAMPPTHR
ncbi:MAG: hypothetical protein DMF78_08295 [Acidobacteria bacterium]|nr:MAG: hypothetical protein DMF78_08295 [Acidobacteriota bacterium]